MNGITTLTASVCVQKTLYVRFSSLVYALYALLRFQTHRILRFQDSQLRMRINTKPNGKQDENRNVVLFCNRQ